MRTTNVQTCRRIHTDRSAPLVFRSQERIIDKLATQYTQHFSILASSLCYWECLVWVWHGGSPEDRFSRVGAHLSMSWYSLRSRFNPFKLTICFFLITEHVGDKVRLKHFKLTCIGACILSREAYHVNFPLSINMCRLFQNQPKNFWFPQHSFGVKKHEQRSFQLSWFNSRLWLHYDVICVCWPVNKEIWASKSKQFIHL